MSKNKQVTYWECDTETTTDINDCRVWSWGGSQINNEDNFIWGKDLTSFVEWCKESNKIIYFHNLRFDGEFLIYWLFTHGYKFRHNALKGDKEYLGKKVKLQAKEFTSTISDDGKYYFIKICFDRGNKRSQYVDIYDSLKKLPFSIKRIAKTFNLPISKAEIDYNKSRPIGYTPDEEEIDYLKRDVKIGAMALAVQLNSGLEKMTIGGDAITFYKNLMGNSFRRYFPLLGRAEESFARKSYKGGFCWVNEKYQGITVGSGMTFDVNSLYPSRMKFCLMPVGKGIYKQGKYGENKMYPLYVQHLKCCFRLKPNKIPTIQLKQNKFFRENEYIKESTQLQELYLTNVDLDLFLEHYDVFECEYIDYYQYRGVMGLFDKYIDYWNGIKMKSKGGQRELAKLMLNNLYGKFSTNGEVKGKYPILRDNGSIGYELLDTMERETVYIPVGIFITAYGRDLTIRSAQACYNSKDINDIGYETECDIVYCDTDSIHIIGNTHPELDIHDKRLGAWKLECTFTQARFLRQKTYIERMNSKREYFDDLELEEMTDFQLELLDKGYFDNIKCCGMTENLKNSLHESDVFDSFYIGLEMHGKLMPKHVKGGIVLTETTFKIK